MKVKRISVDIPSKTVNEIEGFLRKENKEPIRKPPKLEYQELLVMGHLVNKMKNDKCDQKFSMSELCVEVRRGAREILYPEQK